MSQEANLQAQIVHAVQHGLLGRHMDSYDVLKLANLQASWDSACYYQERMLACEVCRDDLTLMEHAASRRSVAGGLVLEFGVASGRTLNHLAGLMPNETVHGFDWFKGLPETWRAGFGAGAFAQGVPQVRENAKLVHGLFDATLPGFVLANRKPVSLLHVDCDLYSSTVTIFDALGGLIVPGTVIVFDEYFNYTGWRQHEYKAFQEFIAASGLRYEYLALVPHHQQVSVLITG